ncbi:Alpha/Beta hydrolase protein [Bisporella sp. PMI_857]|nr:Alpha/Beta hydrolase protein [Bisporella sp. PMI_857]
MTTTTTKVEFKSYDGLTLRGDLYNASQPGSRPCIIMTNGFGGEKHHMIPDFAVRFSAAGYHALIYDNRCWGESDGLPRNETDPIFHQRDYLDAFDFVTTLPDVDIERIVYWGSSMAGGNAIIAAAANKLIRAVISQVPFTSGEMVGTAASMAGPSPDPRAMLGNRRAVREGGADKGVMIPIFPDENGKGGVLSEPGAILFTKEMDRRGIKWEKFTTLQTMANVALCEPIAFIHRISPTPLLMVIAENDVTCPTPWALAMFEKAREPKKLHVVRGAGHFDVYTGQPFEDNIKIQLKFLEEVLA